MGFLTNDPLGEVQTSLCLLLSGPVLALLLLK